MRRAARIWTCRKTAARKLLLVAVSPCLGLSTPAEAVRAQSLHFLLPLDTIEERLRSGPLSFSRIRDTRFVGDRTQRVDLSYPDSTALSAKWAAAPAGGHQFNNAPRYELASYELQKLFLDPDDFVVPPTVVREVPLQTAQMVRATASPTFRGVASTLVVLQYWLPNVVATEIWDRGRFQWDTAYARNVANLNVFTFLARHSDSNSGNFLMSANQANPRVFAVDNGLTFGTEVSDRGTFWRELRVDRIPRATVDRLRSLTRAELDQALGVLAEWEVRDGALHPVPPGPNLSSRSGVRRSGSRVQIGLTASEIAGVQRRLDLILRRVDSGRLTVF